MPASADLQEQSVDAKRLEIKKAMAALGREIERGNQQELVHWVVPGHLACAHGPLRYHPVYGGSRLRLPAEATPLLQECVELIKIEGITSILSLMHEGDLECYRSLPLGNGDLLAYLTQQGFFVARHSYEDPRHKQTPPRTARRTLEHMRTAALKSYDDLPKPVLIQCSAGQDRSAPVAAYIYVHRAAQQESLS